VTTRYLIPIFFTAFDFTLSEEQKAQPKPTYGIGSQGKIRLAMKLVYKREI